MPKLQLRPLKPKSWLSKRLRRRLNKKLWLLLNCSKKLKRRLRSKLKLRQQLN